MPKIEFRHADKCVDAEEGEWMYDVAERAEGGFPSRARRAPAEPAPPLCWKEWMRWVKPPPEKRAP